MICELVQVGVNLDPWNASTASGGGVMENVCDRFFYALTDANFNVLGLALEGPGATPVERYEYTPYGERAVFTHGFIPEDLDSDGRVTNDDVLAANAFAGRTDPEAQAADLDGDGVVTQADVDRVTAAFEKQSPAAAGRDPWVSYAAFHSAPVPYTPFAGSGATSGGRAVGLCEVGHQGLLHDELPGGTLVYNRARMLHPGLGRWIQPDPIGYPDGTNRFAAYHVMHGRLDPWGLYEIEWEGVWTEDQKKKILDSFDRVKDRAGKLLDQLDEFEKGLSCCAKGKMQDDLDGLRRRLNGIIDGIDSTENLELRHRNLDDPNDEAKTYPGGYYWPFSYYDAQTTYNDKTKGIPWYRKTSQDLDTLNIHELAHVEEHWEGDQDGTGSLYDPHVLDDFIKHDLANHPTPSLKKIRAEQECN